MSTLKISKHSDGSAALDLAREEVDKETIAYAEKLSDFVKKIPHLGDAAIWALPKIGFLSSRKVPPAAVMKCYDWATEMRDRGACVMGGFQSPLERDVLTFLLQGKQPVVWVLARRLWTPRGVPKAYRAAIEEGRLLVVSPVSQSIHRVDAQSAAIRNRFILETAQRVVFAALDPEGALSRMLAANSNQNISFNVLR